MTIAYAPGEEKRKLRKEKLKKMRAAENSRRKPALYGAGKVSKRGTQRAREA